MEFEGRGGGRCGVRAWVSLSASPWALSTPVVWVGKGLEMDSMVRAFVLSRLYSAHPNDATPVATWRLLPAHVQGLVACVHLFFAVVGLFA